MQLERVIAALAPADVLRSAPVEIRELAYDARAAGPGSLFFCVPGSRADGHDFAAEAVANGAVALVVERPLELDFPQLVVPDARRAMAPVADAFFGHPSRELEIAGVTGTNGKTTTAFLLYSIYRNTYPEAFRLARQAGVRTVLVLLPIAFTSLYDAAYSGLLSAGGGAGTNGSISVRQNGST